MKPTKRQTKEAARSEVAEVLGAIGPHLLAASQRLHSARPEAARAALRRMALVLRPYLPEARS